MTTKYEPYRVASLVFGMLFLRWLGAHAQITEHHFFLHGFSAASSQMSSISTDMASRFGWSETPTLPSYTSLSPYAIPGVVSMPGGVHSQLYSEHSDGNYVGLGYSCGGLVARYEAKIHAPGFINGLVTLQTPNLGVFLAKYDDRSIYLQEHTRNEGQIGRADYSFLSTLAASVLSGPVQAANQFGSSTLAGVASDMAPGCTFLSDLNATPQPPIPRVAMYATVPWPYSFYYSDQDKGLSNWNTLQQFLRSQSSAEDQKAKEAQSKGRWYKPWFYLMAVYHRMRAGDYTAAANAYIEEELDWEKVTFGGINSNDYASADGWSDGLIGTVSQKGITNPTDVVPVCSCNINHAGEVASTAPYSSRTNVHDALSTAGAH